MACRQICRLSALYCTVLQCTSHMIQEYCTVRCRCSTVRTYSIFTMVVSHSLVDGDKRCTAVRTGTSPSTLLVQNCLLHLGKQEEAQRTDANSPVVKWRRSDDHHHVALILQLAFVLTSHHID